MMLRPLSLEDVWLMMERGREVRATSENHRQSREGEGQVGWPMSNARAAEELWGRAEAETAWACETSRANDWLLRRTVKVFDSQIHP